MLVKKDCYVKYHNKFLREFYAQACERWYKFFDCSCGQYNNPISGTPGNTTGPPPGIPGGGSGGSGGGGTSGPTYQLIPPNLFHLNVQNYDPVVSGISVTVQDLITMANNNANNFGQTGIAYNNTDVRKASSIIEDAEGFKYLSGIDENTSAPNIEGVAPIRFDNTLPQTWVSSVVVSKLHLNEDLIVEGNTMGIWATGVGTNNNFLPAPDTDNYYMLVEREGSVLPDSTTPHLWGYYSGVNTGFPDIKTTEDLPLNQKVVVTMVRGEDFVDLYINGVFIKRGEDPYNGPWDIGPSIQLFWSQPIPFPGASYFVSSPSPYGIYDLRFTDLGLYSSKEEMLFNVQALMDEYNI